MIIIIFLLSQKLVRKKTKSTTNIKQEGIPKEIQNLSAKYNIEFVSLGLEEIFSPDLTDNGDFDQIIVDAEGGVNQTFDGQDQFCNLPNSKSQAQIK